MSVRLVCGNCGVIEEHGSWDAAYEVGWDTVVRFGYNACPSCPGVSVYFPMMYAAKARETTDPTEKAALLKKAAAMTYGPEPGKKWPTFPR